MYEGKSRIHVLESMDMFYSSVLISFCISNRTLLCGSIRGKLVWLWHYSTWLMYEVCDDIGAIACAKAIRSEVVEGDGELCVTTFSGIGIILQLGKCENMLAMKFSYWDGRVW